MAKQEPTAIAAQEAVDPGDALKILIQVADHVEGLHQQGQLHRAISAESGAYDASQAITLSPPSDDDVLFGGAQTDEERCPPELRNPKPIGIPKDLFLARRVLRDIGVPLDPVQIDVYQLGTLLCRLLTGDPIQSYLCSPRTKGRVPSALQPMIERAIGYGSERFTEARQLADALRQQLADSQPQTERDVTSADSPVAGQDVSEETPSVRAADTAPSIVSLAPEPDTSNDSRPVSVPPAAGEELPFDKLGHYEIIERIGHGGMGDVYKAYERALDRTVAIKVLPAEFSRDDEFVKRFYAEATAAARLSHPNIIDVYFIGEDQGRHFFSMQFVDGESLAHLLSQNNRLSVEQSLPIVTQTLAGLAAAHRQGMVHRDVKPGNILIDRENRRCLVADFGLVKSLQGSKQLTATGTVMGTVDYISPEQGKGQPVDARSDLYSVGVLLYRMLSGQLPFQADSPTAMIFQHVYEQPTPLTEVAAAVPPVLSAIVEKLLAKAPDERYANATEVLSDLRAFRENNPLPSGADMVSLDGDDPGIVAVEDAPLSIIIEAPQFDQEPELPEDLDAVVPTGMWGRLRNRLIDAVEERAPEFLGHLQNTQQQVDRAVDVYERRQRDLKNLTGEAESVLRELEQQADEWRKAADEARHKAELAASDDETHQANRTVDRYEQEYHDVAQQSADQREQLESIQLRLAKVTSRLAQLRSQRDLLNARLKVAEARLRFAGGKVAKRRIPIRLPRIPWNRTTKAVCVALTLCVIAVAWFTVYQRSVPPHESIEAHEPAVANVPEESNGSDEAERLPPPDLVVRRFPLRQFLGHQIYTSPVVYSPDGRFIASQDSSKNVKVWDPQTGQILHEFKASNWSRLVFSHDSRLLAGNTTVWDLETGQPTLVLPQLPSDSNYAALSFSADDQALVVLQRSRDSRSIVRFSIDTRKELRRWKMPFEDFGNRSGVLSHDGKLLAIVTKDGQGQVWDTNEQKHLRSLVLPEGTSEIETLSFSFDSALLAGTGKLVTGKSDRGVFIWDIASGRVKEKITTFRDGFRHGPVFDWSGRRLALVAFDRRDEKRQYSIDIWDRRAGRFRAALEITSVFRGRAFSPDGRYLLVGGADPYLALWDASFGPVTISHETLGNVSRVVAFRNRDFVFFAHENRVGVWDLQADRVVREFEQHPDDVSAIDVSADGKLAIAGGGDGNLCLYDVGTGNLLRRINVAAKGTRVSHSFPKRFIRSVAFTPGGTHVLVGTEATMFVWDVQTGAEIHRFEPVRSGRYVVASSPDGKYALGGNLLENLLYDFETGKLVRRFAPLLGSGKAAFFSHDGKWLFSGGKGVVHIGDVETGKEIRRLETGRDNDIDAVALSPDGRRLAGAAAYNSITLWDTETGDVLARYALKNPSRKGGDALGQVERSLSFSHDGKYLISAGRDGKMRLWDADIGD